MCLIGISTRKSIVQHTVLITFTDSKGDMLQKTLQAILTISPKRSSSDSVSSQFGWSDADGLPAPSSLRLFPDGDDETLSKQWAKSVVDVQGEVLCGKVKQTATVRAALLD